MAGKRRAKVTRGQRLFHDPNTNEGPDNPRLFGYIDLTNDNSSGGVRHPSIQETLDLFKRIADGVLQHEATKPADDKYLDCAKDHARHVLDIVPHAETLAKSDDTKHALMVGIDLAIAFMAIPGLLRDAPAHDELLRQEQQRNRGRDSRRMQKERRAKFAKDFIRGELKPGKSVRGLHRGYLKKCAEKCVDPYKISAFRKLIKEIEAEEVPSGNN